MGNIQTIQQTSKIWKLMSVIGVIGAITLFYKGFSLPDGDGSVQILGGMFFVIVYMVAKIGKWWQNA